MTVFHSIYLKIRGREIFTAVSFLLAAALLLSCGEKMDLPSSPESVAFSAGDTTYIHLAPDWLINDGIPLSDPCDIVVGPEGYVFVADRGNNRIAVFDRVGNTVEAGWRHRLTDLENLPEWESENSVEAVGQDEKLNLFIVNGGPTVWYWNQYLNTIGVEAVLDHIVVYDTLENDTTEMNFIEWSALDNESPYRYVPVDYVFDDDPARIDSVLTPAIFYQDPVGLSKYRGVAGGPDETVYVTDLTDRVSRLTVLYQNLVLLKNGYFGYTYTGEFERDVAVYGSGMGTTQDPAGIYVQVQGSQHFIYFTQTGGYFKAQKIREEGVGNFFSAFGPDTDFMQLDRFADPMDIWVAQQYLGGNWIFVADTDSNRVQVFNPEGDFLMYAGVRDSSGVEIFDELDHPEGVAHFEGILYVTDTGNNRIVRYALSSDIENIPGQ